MTTSKKRSKLKTRAVPSKSDANIAGTVVGSPYPTTPYPTTRIAVPDAHPWDTSKGRKWVVVAFWGEETTVSFHRDEDEANEAYEDATRDGADAFYAKTSRMMMQSDPIGDERTK